MTPAAQGRYCAACQETVIDFTSMSDPEILAFLKLRPDVSCGRFQRTQLARPLVPLPPASARWRTWVAATASLLALREIAAADAAAQQKIPDVALPQLARRPDPAVADERTPPAAVDSLHISGTVHSWWGRPLSHARVTLNGRRTYTNALGYFSLTVPARLVEAGYSLSASLPMHGSKRVLLEEQRHTYIIRLRKYQRFVGGKFR
ncbi:carboxypeptidase-like regulatory domain-containing protein [Hymenobacter pini]|uniref:carboxypeptidase-like regulatory domain-containing protein n=1 Tax=Hymenobacter pini TaxID=2880879 RepID=UPI001CF4CEB3|nr:carboxypeptidase-like regulatory domain-containing protein [Hymenobacter pini]MCA8832875.1 carboxypeptidase-like regulatory domain-containing protein [Hymenobacter pini]